jgi:hypothetical protein
MAGGGSLTPSFDSCRYARLDQRGGGAKGNPDGSRQAVRHTGDLGGGAIFVDDQPYAFDPAKPERGYCERGGAMGVAMNVIGHRILLSATTPVRIY